MILYNLNHIASKNWDLPTRALIASLFFLFGAVILNAQAPHCHTDEMLGNHLDQKSIKEEIALYEEQLSNTSPTRDEGIVHTIPVVVHIIHAGESIGNGPNLSQTKILEQLDILNDDFNQLNADQNLIPAEFAGLAANVEIEFCLARTTPDGNATNGITRSEYGSISSINFIESNIKPQTQWDPTRYMNLWIVRMPDPSILGYAYLPSPTFLHTHLDGVVLSHLKVGNQNSTTRGRTLVHEVGHYLGLPHLWGFTENDCDEDDFISDTPAVRTPYYGCPSYPQFTCGTSDMFMNYMDYVDDNCMHMFTEGQKTVMRSIINNQRKSLISNTDTACSTTVSTNNSPELNELVKIYPNPCQDDLTISTPDNHTIQSITVYDSSGRVLDFQVIPHKDSSSTYYLDTNAYQDGMHVLKIETRTGESYAKRFVKLTN